MRTRKNSTSRLFMDRLFDVKMPFSISYLNLGTFCNQFPCLLRSLKISVQLNISVTLPNALPSDSNRGQAASMWCLARQNLHQPLRAGKTGVVMIQPIKCLMSEVTCKPAHPSMLKAPASGRPGGGLFLMKPCLPESSSWRIVVFPPVFGFPEGAKRTECELTLATSLLIVNV